LQEIRLTRIRGVVEGVAGYERPTVQAARQHELYLRHPFLHSLGLRLAPLVVLFKIIGKVAIQIEATGVVPVCVCVREREGTNERPRGLGCLRALQINFLLSSALHAHFIRSLLDQDRSSEKLIGRIIIGVIKRVGRRG